MLVMVMCVHCCLQVQSKAPLNLPNTQRAAPAPFDLWVNNSLFGPTILNTEKLQNIIFERLEPPKKITILTTIFIFLTVSYSLNDICTCMVVYQLIIKLYNSSAAGLTGSL